LSLLPAIHRVESVIKQLDLDQKREYRTKFTPEVYEELKKSTFDIWAYTEDDYIHFMAQMLKQLGIADHFSIPEPTLMNFLSAVQKCYNSNPFHNFKHAFCVTQMVLSIDCRCMPFSIWA
jgi:high affinity cGMP-specific 3',5'-cyclic phosphodiesterase 9